MSPTILVIEDEQDLRTLLRVLLERADYEVLDASDGRSGLRVFHERQPDLVILDLGLPLLDGWQVLERIRDLSDAPVLLLTARGMEAEKVRGLQSGADDYITKPFGRDELLARVHAALRRSQGSGGEQVPVFDDGRLVVDFVAKRVCVGDGEIALTPIEYRLLTTLVRHSGQVLTAEQLLEHAWDDPTGVGPDRVKFAILRLRRKLGFDDVATSPIKTVRGFGYRYAAPTTG